jgi:hypothetical protein
MKYYNFLNRTAYSKRADGLTFSKNMYVFPPPRRPYGRKYAKLAVCTVLLSLSWGLSAQPAAAPAPPSAPPGAASQPAAAGPAPGAVAPSSAGSAPAPAAAPASLAKVPDHLDDAPSIKVNKSDNWNWQKYRRVFVPRAGLVLAPMFTTGQIGEVMDSGVAGLQLQWKQRLPWEVLDYKFLKPVIAPARAAGIRFYNFGNIGLHSFSSNESQTDKVSLNLIPVTVNLSAGYAVPQFTKLLSVEPYFGFDYGLTMASMEATPAAGSARKAVTESSIDATFGMRLGAAVKVRQLRMLEFQLELRMLTLFESFSSTMTSISLGASYYL